MTERMSCTTMFLLYGMWVAEKTVAPPETIDTTASVSSLVVRSRSGKLEQVERHRACSDG